MRGAVRPVERLFGKHALEAAEAGQAVFLDHVGLALNQRQAVVDEVLRHAVALGVDPLDRDLLFIVGHGVEVEQLGIADIDVVIISMASNLEASVLAVTLCRELGVGRIIAKCASEMHRKILLRVGADSVVFPEQESGVRLAKNLLSSGFVDMISLSDEVSVVELDVKDEWVGRNLIELNLRKRYSVNVVAMKRNGTVDVEVNPELPLESGMTLIAIVNTKKLSKLK
mgnify:CR=1 FL=1